MHLSRTTTLTRVTLAALLLLALPTMADARSRHHRQTQQPAEAAATTTTGQSRQHVQDEHARQASQEVDKILDGKMKSICRGC